MLGIVSRGDAGMNSTIFVERSAVRTLATALGGLLTEPFVQRRLKSREHSALHEEKGDAVQLREAIIGCGVDGRS